jgi:hypothetical protein
VHIDVWEGGDACAEARRFRDRWDLGGTILIDHTAAYARRLDVTGVPTNVLVDADGTVRAVGAVRLDELEDAVERLLRGSSA